MTDEELKIMLEILKLLKSIDERLCRIECGV